MPSCCSLLLANAPPPVASRAASGANGLTISLLVHAGALLIAAIAVERAASPSAATAAPVVRTSLVYARPGGGGPGGGGENQRLPATSAQADARTLQAIPSMRAAAASVPSPQPDPQPDPVQRLQLPDQPIEAGLRDAIGTSADRPGEIASRGPGSGPGADGGRGPGIGRRDGSGIGDKGPGLGEGDGEEPGNGVSWPRLLQEVKPNYTAEAMRARVEGLVMLEIVVLPDGSVGRVSVVRSLDDRFGLDQEAINAVRRWRFDPGRRLGKAIAVRVGVELSFNLR
jgi:TonB family protein